MEFPALDIRSWDAGLHERLAALRSADPVHYDPGSKLWILTRYDDVVHASKNANIFSSAQGTRIHDIGFKNSIIDMDDPEHTAQRRTINRGFTPRMVSNLERDFRRMTVETLDALAGKSEFDFIHEVSVPLPLRLIARMIGIEEERYADFHRWSDDMMSGGVANPSPEATAAAAKAALEYITYVTQIMDARRKSPQDDLVTTILQASDEGLIDSSPDSFGTGIANEAGEGLETSQIQVFLILLLIAGNETTRNAISGGVAALIENPDQYDRLRAHPELMPLAVNEVVRYVSPVINFTRTVTQDTEIGGQKLGAGERVLMVYPAANRDPAVFTDPDRFDVGRDPNPHVGFGIGPHYCLGANLARMEISVVLEELLARYRRIEFTGTGPTIVPHDLVRTHVDMPVRTYPLDD